MLDAKTNRRRPCSSLFYLDLQAFCKTMPIKNRPHISNSTKSQSEFS
ncbi:hypothetical protein CAMRE0001_2157 [Campylobacter rectus RM3267]|uniref:Uncharacterized protein n=1 Tax=Campylobacter rectus RM3267 TaxID=553218 RepID=B9D461_CAMRE|nr:hypothetical protein CAMRE0001_2157 [Campylobacter rectus RM3267]